MATFGLRYFAQLRSKYKGVFWRVEIAERDYSDPSEEMEFAGSSPLSIYRNTVLYWRGFVVADLYSESFTAPPYEVGADFPQGWLVTADGIWPSSRCINSLYLPNYL